MSTNSEIVTEVNAKYAARLDRARTEAGRTGDWRQARIAEIHLAMQAEISARVAERDQEARRQRARLEYRVFGPAGDASDASEIISRRDAGDRAKQLTSEQEAVDLLASADRIRDESLARAIAERSFEMGWGTAINEFLRDRQHLVKAAQTLWDTSQPSLAEELSEAAVTEVVPPELRGLNSSQIARLGGAVNA